MYTKMISNKFCILNSKLGRFVLLSVSLLILLIVLTKSNDRHVFYLKPFYQTDFRLNHLNKYLSHHFDDMEIRPVTHGPYSPIDYIPEYDRLVALERKSTWNPFERLKFHDFNELLLQDRCNFYFRELYNLNTDWSNDYHRLKFDIYEETDFKQENLGDNQLLNDKEIIRIFNKKNDVKLALQRLRIYDRCFIQNDNLDIRGIFNDSIIPSKNIQQKKHIKRDLQERALNKRDMINKDNYKEFDIWDFEKRMFPFLKKFDEKSIKEFIPNIIYGSKTLPRGKIPILTDDTRLKAKLSDFTYDPSKSFWSNWNFMSHNIARRGISMCIGDGQLKLALKLITTLRYSGNTLPIQIIMKKGELSKGSIEKLIFAAQGNNFKFRIDKDEYKPASSYMPQEILFTDITDLLDPEFLNDFQWFKNKWLASIFNVFEENIFLDADVVPYVDLNFFFNTKEYNETGTIFFKDRSFEQINTEKCDAFLESINPLLPEGKYFDNHPYIDTEYVSSECEYLLNPTEAVYKNFFINRNQHQMEAGLYAVDMRSHIIPLIVGMTLHMLPVATCSYGDKEFFWLGFLASGHSYAFHPMNVATVGYYKQLHNTGDKIVDKVCSTQIAHMDTDYRMLWTNAGASVCKKPEDSQVDWERKGSKWPKDVCNSAKEIEDYYNSPVDPRWAMVSKGESSGWERLSDSCQGYMWCAFRQKSRKEFSYDEYTEKGHLVEYTGEEYEHIKTINFVWSYLEEGMIGKVELQE
ncbi:hypothetical protein TBLA_0A00640 [Henningerozyma blattae CBS 6284]|uniref:Alpha-1,3-mannosyltransferase n=1 Tax=Henningerozyma blattae (strain ATCC 34711 / CBS 6284 / DSM 70876 / NBRC 10599 / NRRL Y-10934 / UCD 77-7) TaxID=1071380 RepID=I2GUR3_HENB6|nr:hypothetical protein TBLA_0A00640 [Tetrapisispora blattae CBS 6284]CCH57865.1 hypothetical protein TBLA_0A00640 [Tetrapisispora blattae CBS 6284]